MSYDQHGDRLGPDHAVVVDEIIRINGSEQLLVARQDAAVCPRCGTPSPVWQPTTPISFRGSIWCYPCQAWFPPQLQLSLAHVPPAQFTEQSVPPPLGPPPVQPLAQRLGMSGPAGGLPELPNQFAARPAVQLRRAPNKVPEPTDVTRASAIMTLW